MLATLINYRLHWYARATLNLLQRHWQFALIAGFLLFPQGGTPAEALEMLATPVQTIFTNSQTVLHSFICLFILTGGALLWSRVQRESLLGGPFQPYLQSLPLDAKTKRMANIAVLLVSDSLFLLPGVAFLFVADSQPVALAEKIGAWNALTVLFALLLATQVRILEGATVALLALIPAVLLAGLGLATATFGGKLLFLNGALLIALYLLTSYNPALTRKLVFQRHQLSSYAWAYRLLGPVWVIPARYLLGPGRGIVLSRIGLALLPPVFVIKVVAAGYLHDVARIAELTTIGFCALICSNLHLTLWQMHESLAAYFRTLPIGKWFWSWRDSIIVMLVSQVPLLLLALWLRHPLHVSHLLIDLMYTLLVLLFRWTKMHGGEHEAIWNLLLVGVWTAAVVMLVG